MLVLTLILKRGFYCTGRVYERDVYPR